MIPDPASRWVVIGNSGSGKSTLAERLSTDLHLSTYDLDLIHWHQDGRKREEADAKARVAEIAAGDGWVIEGVYGWLAEVALARATALIWLDLPWDDCRDGLLARGLRHGMTPSDQEVLLAWAEDYWTRTTPSSFTGHELLYRMFAGRKAHMRTRMEVATFVQWQSNFGEGSNLPVGRFSDSAHSVRTAALPWPKASGLTPGPGVRVRRTR